MQNVIIRNEAGREKTVSQRAWDLMASKTEPGDTRKGWTKVGTAQGKQAPVGAPMGPRASFLPEEIREHHAKQAADAEREAVTGMIAGAPPVQKESEPKAPVAPAEPTKAPDAPAKEAPPAAPAAPAPAAAPAAPAPADEPAKGDDIASIPGIGAKVAEALKAEGIDTFAKLAAAETSAINKVLDGIAMSPKKAQVPNWRNAAKAKSDK